MQTPRLPVDCAFVRRLLRDYPVDDQDVRIEQPPYARGFSGACIVQLTIRGFLSGVPRRTNETTLCLRGWPLSGLPSTRLCELHRVLRFLQNRGIEVLPVPIPDLRGETLVSHDGRFWQLEPWLPGAADFWQSPTDARLQSCMRTLAHVHRAAEAYVPSARGRDWFREPHYATSAAVLERSSLVESWTLTRLQDAMRQLKGDPDLRFRDAGLSLLSRFQTARQGLLTDLSQMSRVSVPLQICIRDIWHDHVLFTGEEVTGVVDPSAARTESVTVDLSRLLGSLLGTWNDRWELALRTYESLRPLSRDERSLIPVLQVSGALLSGMTWIERYTNNHIPLELRSAVVARLEDLNRQLE